MRLMNLNLYLFDKAAERIKDMMNKQNNPLVSVIMPCYNHEKFVGQSIESVLNQTYDNIEFIVLDNGSTDRSYDVIKRYDGKIDKIMQFTENDLNAAGRVLLENCTGNYIAFMTSDDIWDRQKIEKQMEVLIENEGIKACFTWADTVDENLNLTGSQGMNIFRQKNRSRYDWLEKLILEGNCLAFPSALVAKDAYFAVFDKLKPFYQLGDLFTWIQMLLENDIYVIEEPLVWFRWHSSETSRNMSLPNYETNIRTRNEKIILIEEIIEEMEDEMFIRTFGKFFRRQNACSEEEILCEKFFLFLKLAENNVSYGQCAINYYFRHNRYSIKYGYSLANMLDSMYGYGYMDFQNYCVKFGMGALNYQIQTLRQEQNFYLSAWRTLWEAMNTEPDLEHRQMYYRKRMFQGLQDDKKEIVKLVLEYIKKILVFIDKADDGMTDKEFGQIIYSVRGIKDILQDLWSTFLWVDLDIKEEEWNLCKETMQKESITAEEFCDFILPFLLNCYSILLQYSS